MTTTRSPVVAAGHAVLTTAQLDELCAHLDLDPPPALAPGPHDPPTPAGDTVRHPRITTDIDHLARAPLAVDVQLPGPDTAAVAAVDTGRGTLAVRRGSHITLHRLAPQQAIDAVTDLLGPLHPAPGPPAHVPVPVLTAALAAAGDDPQRLEVELMRRGMTTPCARALVAANTSVDAVSRIGATLRTPHGPRRSPYLLTVQHTPAGHHYQRPHRTRGGADVLHTAPATTTRIRHALDDLIRATADTGGRGPHLATP